MIKRDQPEVEPSGMALQLVHVNVCGQQLEAHCEKTPPSLQLLKETVQRGVGMQADWIQFFDKHGIKLLTDAEVTIAIHEGRTPIYASIADHAVHELEHRQEEFAQMQWKVLRDQFKILSLQLGHTQEELKELKTVQEAARVKDLREEVDGMKQELKDGLGRFEEVRTTSAHVENLVGELNDTVHNVRQKLDQEINRRNNALLDVDVKIDSATKSWQHEADRLAEVFDTHVKLQQQVHEGLGQDLQVAYTKIEAARELAITQHAAALQEVAESRKISAEAIRDASSSLIKQAREDAAVKVNEVADRIAEFQTRIIKGETLASDTAKKWLASNEQLKSQYNSVLQSVEQCRLSNRATNASVQDITRKIEPRIDSLKSILASIKEEQLREQTRLDEQVKKVQQSIDASQKSALTDLEMRLNVRVEREADARTACILQALDDIGAVLEQEIPSKIRQSFQVSKRSPSPSSEATLPKASYRDASGCATPVFPSVPTSHISGACLPPASQAFPSRATSPPPAMRTGATSPPPAMRTGATSPPPAMRTAAPSVKPASPAQPGLAITYNLGSATPSVPFWNPRLGAHSPPRFQSPTRSPAMGAYNSRSTIH